MVDHQFLERSLDPLCALALEAGREAMAIYDGDFAAERKNDGSPVTEADRRGEAIILEGLKKLAPDIPVLAEEQASEGVVPELGRTFFLVDPLDGTKEFINRTGEFTVNIGLVDAGAPVLGVVAAPAASKLYFGSSELGAWRSAIGANFSPAPREKIRARPRPAEGLVAVASRSHRSPETEEFLKMNGAADFVAAGSSLKFCLIAEGLADLYPRFGRTMEWDTAAGDAVLRAAGGSVRVHPGGEPLRYGKSDRGFDNPHFIAAGRG